jgi:DNA-binding NtrC family response regulator
MKKSNRDEREPILVIDDDEVTRLSIGYALRRAGQPKSVGCGDGAEAREILSRCGFSAVLLDLFMPHLSGWAVLSWIRKNRPELPVIVVSGHDSDEIKEECRRDGAFDYIAKPFDERMLIRSVDRALAHAR